MSSRKAAILIYCTQEEREQIRLAAKQERRTISGFVMNAVMTTLTVEGRLREGMQKAIADRGDFEEKDRSS
jgi:hypothetical protein